MNILNIAAYKFLKLEQLETLQIQLHDQIQHYDLKGTILLSSEGINLNLSGHIKSVLEWKVIFNQDSRFNDMIWHESYSDKQPFRKLKIKIKKEIITFRQPQINTLEKRSKAISPATLKKWLDEQKDIILLDTRNDYEIDFGTFKNARHLNLTDFSQLPEAISALEKDKPIVMFCTGGIRCEKAALFLEKKHFNEVYQLDGGILGYFAQVGGYHYQGDCFVFDERIAVNTKLEPSNKSSLRGTE